MKLSLKLLETNNTISKTILQAMLPASLEFMSKAKNIVENNIITLIQNQIISSPEYDSLINGQLKLELGIPDADRKIQELINTWISNTVVNYTAPKIVNNKIKSSFTVKMIKSNFSDVINQPSAFIEDNIRGYELPWLQWLLFDGTAIIVDDYEVVIGTNARSRTGYAVMMPSSNSWSVPAEFAGTVNDNWITRAIQRAKPDIEKLLEKAVSQ
jgi:hypothetical protein